MKTTLLTFFILTSFILNAQDIIPTWPEDSLNYWDTLTSILPTPIDSGYWDAECNIISLIDSNRFEIYLTPYMLTQDSDKYYEGIIQALKNTIIGLKIDIAYLTKQIEVKDTIISIYEKGLNEMRKYLLKL